MHILITGGTGMVGSRLTSLLLEEGHQVRHLSRNPESSNKIPTFKWDIETQEIDARCLEGVDAIIHLAGAGVADKAWTRKRKQIILESRTKSAALLKQLLSSTQHQVKAVVSASGIAYYGWDCGGIVKDEESRFGDDFLATVAKAWEAEIDLLHPVVSRIIKFRIGLVLSDKGGALTELVKPVKLGASAPLGSGDQYMSWIHIDDLCRAFIYAAENPAINGTFNLVAPQPVTNKEFMKAVAKTLNKPMFLPNVPNFAIKLMLGERASMLLGGSNISSAKIQSVGFEFKFDNLPDALASLLKK